MNIYREHILDHYRNPRHYGKLAQPTVTVDETNPVCGDHLHIELSIEHQKIREIAFEGGGCAISLAAASVLAEELAGRPVQEVTKFTDAKMLSLLGVPLSPTRTKCGLLALSGLRAGLRQYTESHGRHEANQSR